MGALAAEEARIRKHWQPMYYFGRLPKIGVLQKFLIKPYPLTRMAGRFITHAQRRRLRDALSAPNLTRPPLPPEARARLLPVLCEDIIKLQELLGRDLSGWLK